MAGPGAVTGVGRTGNTPGVDAATHAQQQVQRFVGLPHGTTRGPEINALQRALNVMGAGLTLDSIYGSKTEAATRNFLARDMPELQQGAGVRGRTQDRAAVRRLQLALNAITGSNLVADGKFGGKTQEALVGWQQSVGINNPSPEGVVNRGTWNALLAGMVGKWSGVPVPTPRPSITTAPTATGTAGALQPPVGNSGVRTPSATTNVVATPTTVPAATATDPAATAPTTDPAATAPTTDPAATAPTTDPATPVSATTVPEWAGTTERGAQTEGLQYGMNIIAGAGLDPDGVPGTDTQAAVRNFFSRDFPELAQGAGLDGQNRADVIRLQKALNAATGGNLGVDGKFGGGTEAALVAWQQSVENAGTPGKVNRDTWVALLQGITNRAEQDGGIRGIRGIGSADWVPNNLSRLSNSGVGTRLPTNDPNIHHYKPLAWGTARTIATIEAVAAEYNARTGYVLRVGDISKQGGGDVSGHGSHEYGRNVDLDLAFNDGRTTAEASRNSTNATWRSPAYDRDATRTLIRLIRQARPGVQILFSDPVLVAEGLVTRFSGHDNHMHLQSLGG